MRSITKRKKNPKLRQQVKSTGCVICGKVADPCHIKTFGSTRIDAEWNLIAMCRIHHSKQHRIGWQKMMEEHYIVKFYLLEKGWTWEIVNGKFYLFNEKLI